MHSEAPRYCPVAEDTPAAPDLEKNEKYLTIAAPTTVQHCPELRGRKHQEYSRMDQARRPAKYTLCPVKIRLR